MREIKFRAKRIDNGEFVYGYYFLSPLTDENSGVSAGNGWTFLSDGRKRSCISTEDGVVYVVDKQSVAQYTGLKDKNGKEIYEGDIIEHEVWDRTYSDRKKRRKVKKIVRWYINEDKTIKGDSVNMVRIDAKIIDGQEDGSYIWSEFYRCEVIGNIYENKDLLK